MLAMTWLIVLLRVWVLDIGGLGGSACHALHLLRHGIGPTPVQCGCRLQSMRPIIR